MAIQLPYNPAPPGAWPVINIPNPGNQAYFTPFAKLTWTSVAPTSKLPQAFQAPPTFSLFPLLPPELRLRIWSFAAPHQRVLEIRSWGTSRYGPIKFSIHPHYLPSIFRVCKESRMEALRIYKMVKIGVSAAVRVEGRKYVEWRYHPSNPNAVPGYTVGTAPLPYAIPHEPKAVFVSWEHDVIYLGPEFKAHHLLMFMTTTGEGRELEGIKYLAIDRKLWLGAERGNGDVLRSSLYSLKERKEMREVIVVPDDEERALIDKWYRGKHEISLHEPEWTYTFQPLGREQAPIFLECLEEWFDRLWKWDPNAKEVKPNTRNDSDGEDDPHNEDRDEESNGAEENTAIWIDKGKEKEIGDKEAGPEPPTIKIMSVRRNGGAMRGPDPFQGYKDGVWDIQKALGDMRIWKSWTPPAST